MVCFATHVVVFSEELLLNIFVSSEALKVHSYTATPALSLSLSFSDLHIQGKAKSVSFQTVSNGLNRIKKTFKI